jgi:superfamily II DNA/RNA helicase
MSSSFVALMNMSNAKKNKIYEKFVKSESNIKILCVTNVIELEMNISNVKIIISWKISSNVKALMQRDERVARDVDRRDELI